MITILAPAYYTSWTKVKYLKESAALLQTPIHWYGFGKPYTGWYNVQIIDLLEELKAIDTDYILYTDSSDAILNTKFYPPTLKSNADWIIMSQELDGGLCAGGWFGPREYAIHCLEFLKDFVPTETCDILNPQERWREASNKGYLSVIPDAGRAFFQVMDEPLDVVCGILYNPRTRTFPAFCHWAGGYTDPEAGKSALIEPYWSQL